MVDNIIRPGTIGQWNYVDRLESETRASLENVTALFAPSCFSHSLIVKQSWNQININGFKLPHVLNSWEEETLTNQPTLEQLNQDLELASASQQQSWISDSQAALISRDDRAHRAQATLELRSAGQQRSINNGNLASTGTSSRPKSRKRKRNNNNNNGNSANNQQHSGNNRIGPLATNRLSRSTSTDDATIIFNNNVPDASPQHGKYSIMAKQFLQEMEMTISVLAASLLDLKKGDHTSFGVQRKVRKIIGISDRVYMSLERENAIDTKISQALKLVRILGSLQFKYLYCNLRSRCNTRLA